ncbi:hypothetical protein TSMEX_005726, partial [Taenia solium]
EARSDNRLQVWNVELQRLENRTLRRMKLPGLSLKESRFQSIYKAVECPCLSRLCLKRNEMDTRRGASGSSALIGCFCYLGLLENRVA